tara:strand:- start:156 stop:1061 length:906 start_codon:yes stop_codon:yes gene_type:complete
MNAHWPKHKVYHTTQKLHAEQIREGTLPGLDRESAKREARRAEETGDEFDKRVAAAVALNAEGNHHATAKAWRKIIKQWPDEPTPYFNLAVALDRSDRNVESAQMFLKAMELFEEGTEDWAISAASAFDLLKHPDCCQMTKPEWWNDEALKALSARVVALTPDSGDACSMRARVLRCDDNPNTAPWKAGPRTAAEIKEAATWFRHSARFFFSPAEKLFDEKRAIDCDEVADDRLAEEEAEATQVRAAAEAEAKAAREEAEAKANAAADELLAEEETEKAHAAGTKAGKAKQSKGKKGKGKR